MITRLGLPAAALALASQLAVAACTDREPTRETGPGPHDYSVAPADSKLWHEGDAGEPLFIRVRVLDTCGTPVPDALVQVLHANHDGHHEAGRWRAQLRSDARGELQLVTVFPGYAGSIARHIHFIITHPDHDQLVTRMFFKNDPAVDDAQDGLLEDLAVVLEAVERNGARGWIAGTEFVLRGN